MKEISVEDLSIENLWVSMIENWGDANKEFHHCEESQENRLEVCLLKSSKYMWRMFSAMKCIRRRLTLQTEKTDGLLGFDAENFTNPEYAAKVWMGFRKQAMREIPKTDREKVQKFFEQFDCDSEAFGEPLSPACISKMNDKVNAYNVKLAGLVTDDKPIEDARGKGKAKAKAKGKGKAKGKARGKGKGYGRKQDWALDEDWGPGAFFKF